MTGITTRPGGTGPLGSRTVSRIGYGAMALERFEHDPELAVALLRRAVELGVDHIDTADFYGRSVSNDLIRRAIGSDPAITVVTKVGAVRVEGGTIPLALEQRPEQLRAQVQANLRSLSRERLDVVNLRRPEVGPGITLPDDELVDIDDQLAELLALRDDGVIGAIGLSAVRPATVQRALPAGIVCVQNAYSVLSRGFEDTLALCRAEGVAWVPYFPLGSAFPQLPKVTDDAVVRTVAAEAGATPAQVGLAWLLAHAPNILLIPGTGSIPHLEENTSAGAVTLTPEQLARLDAIAAAPVSAA
ncbi:aldo/keto reductase [Leifsonia sp. ku-ls]|nr:aldo/keto reductase [Leifsonia sp. ku-ls]